MAQLTVKQIAAIKEPGKYRVGGRHLLLQVSRSGTRSWIFRYRRNGVSHDMGLGSAAIVPLTKARDDALHYARLLADNKDPIAERRAERRQVTSPKTFREFTDQFVRRQAAGWRNPKTAKQFVQTLRRHAYPVIGDLPVHEIDVDHLVTILEPIWPTIPVMADHVRSNVAVVLDAAKAKGLRFGDNPARWAGTLKHLLPIPKKVRKPKHHPAMDYQDVPGFMKLLRQRDTIAAKALEFTILTAARTSEVIGCRWTEIDLDAGLWTVPDERMKSGVLHRVPLSPRAIAILRDLPREESDYVFIGPRRGRGLSNMTMLKALRSMRSGVTVHGFRAAFRGWAGVVARARHEVAEAALAHVTGSKTVRAYTRREDYIDERRDLMVAWAAYCS